MAWDGVSRRIIKTPFTITADLGANGLKAASEFADSKSPARSISLLLFFIIILIPVIIIILLSVVVAIVVGIFYFLYKILRWLLNRRKKRR